MSTDFVALLPGEVAMSYDGETDELLYRQIQHFNWSEETQQPSVDAFGPAGSDHRKPSFARATVVTAQESFDWHQEFAVTPSLAVWALSVTEVEAGQTRAVDDSAAPLDPEKIRSPGHCYVDYQHLDKPGMRRLKAFLLAQALGRGQILKA